MVGLGGDECYGVASGHDVGVAARRPDFVPLQTGASMGQCRRDPKRYSRCFKRALRVLFRGEQLLPKAPRRARDVGHLISQMGKDELVLVVRWSRLQAENLRDFPYQDNAVEQVASDSFSVRRAVNKRLAQLYGPVVGGAEDHGLPAELRKPSLAEVTGVLRVVAAALAGQLGEGAPSQGANRFKRPDPVSLARVVYDLYVLVFTAKAFSEESRETLLVFAEELGLSGVELVQATRAVMP